MSHDGFKKYPMSCRLFLSSRTMNAVMHVGFKKYQCRCVELRGPEPPYSQMPFSHSSVHWVGEYWEVCVCGGGGGVHPTMH